MTNVFLSHKHEYAAQAHALARTLSKIVPSADIFCAEDTETGKDWREGINGALKSAKCFVFLYTDPALNWSWCFYEAGLFVNTGRPVSCLHPLAVAPPSPLANLQTVRADHGPIVKWLEDFRGIFNCKTKCNKRKITAAARFIGKLVNEAGPLQEESLKPYICIEPKWKGNWNATNKIPKIDFSDASVFIDRESAQELRFKEVPELTLLPFLRMIACDAADEDGRLEFWIKKFFEFLQEAVKGKLDFKEAAFFRHENGKIYRPVVVGNAKNASGTRCQLRVVLAPAFGSPLTDSPGPVQRLSVGARLAVRTRLEVLEPFLGHTSEIYKKRVRSKRPEDEISRRSPVGGRIVEALEVIWQEALSNGVRPGEVVPTLFEGPDQELYEKVRARGYDRWSQIKKAALAEDKAGTGKYPKTEHLLAELKQINEDYLAIVLPRIEELLVPVEKRRGKGDLGIP